MAVIALWVALLHLVFFIATVASFNHHRSTINYFGKRMTRLFGTVANSELTHSTLDVVTAIILLDKCSTFRTQHCLEGKKFVIDRERSKTTQHSPGYWRLDYSSALHQPSFLYSFWIQCPYLPDTAYKFCPRELPCTEYS